MTSIKEFMMQCHTYFGGFQNKTVADEIAKELRYVKPADYHRLYRQLMSDVPANWKPDYKAVNDAIYKLKLDRLVQPGIERVCPVCNSKNYTNSCCPVCKYDKLDGDPNKYRKFWEDYKAGKIEQIDTQKIILDLAKAKGIE